MEARVYNPSTGLQRLAGPRDSLAAVIHHSQLSELWASERLTEKSKWTAPREHPEVDLWLQYNTFTDTHPTPALTHRRVWDESSC